MTRSKFPSVRIKCSAVLPERQRDTTVRQGGHTVHTEVEVVRRNNRVEPITHSKVKVDIVSHDSECCYTGKGAGQTPTTNVGQHYGARRSALHKQLRRGRAVRGARRTVL